MATKIWKGQAPAVAQSDWAQCTGVQNGQTYSVVINGETINSSTAGGTTSALQLCQALASGFNAATGNPYARAITSTGYTTGGFSYLRMTADVAGNPYTWSISLSGPTGGGFSAVTGLVSNSGPNDWATAANWSGGTVPTTGDDLIFRDSSSSLLWGLDQNTLALGELIVEQSYTGVIGLNQRQFVTGTGAAASTDRSEYREDYLRAQFDTIRIGETVGPGEPAGSGRIKVDNTKAGSSTTTIYNSGTAALDSNMPVVRLLYANAGADLYVRSGSGGVGVAVDDASETTTMGDINVSDKTAASQVYIGEGVTFDTYTQDGGDNVLRSAAAVTGITVNGGLLSIEGKDYAITTLNVNGGTVYPNSTPTGGSAITTVNIKGGTVDGSRSRVARTWGTVNLQRAGASLQADPDVVTITTLNEPTDSGTYTLVVQ